MMVIGHRWHDASDVNVQSVYKNRMFKIKQKLVTHLRLENENVIPCCFIFSEYNCSK